MPLQCNGDNVENDLMMLLVYEIRQWLEGSACTQKGMLAALVDQITGTQYNGDNVEHVINKIIQYNTCGLNTVCI